MENNSGWYPLLHRILVYPKPVETKTEGGIVYVLEVDKRREEMAQVTGIVVACGPETFSDQPNSKVPQAGDEIMFGKLSGFFVRGTDGKEYRMINDLDVVAVKGEKHE